MSEVNDILEGRFGKTKRSTSACTLERRSFSRVISHEQNDV
jgi:hypothetical protein